MLKSTQDCDITFHNVEVMLPWDGILIIFYVRPSGQINSRNLPHPQAITFYIVSNPKSITNFFVSDPKDVTNFFVSERQTPEGGGLGTRSN